jgi:DNA-binding Xre family transcriptional regulator
MSINKIKLGIAMATKGLNFKQLGEITGISKTTLSLINNGKQCGASILYKIAVALEVEPESLLSKGE